MQLIQRFLSDRTGATAIEYGLLATLIALAAMVGFTLFADSLEALFGSNDSRLRQALGA